MCRIMMVVPKYPYPVVGGLERQAHELAKALTEKGVHVQVLSAKVEPTQPAREFVESILVHRILWLRWRWLRFLRTPFDLFRILYIERERYDIVHIHQNSWFGLFAILSARLLNKPTLTKLPNVGKLGIPGLLEQRFGRLRLAILWRSDALIAMSKESIRELEEIGYPKKRILATPNGIRLEERIEPLEKNKRTSLCRVVFVGRLSEEKRIDNLLYAWRHVVDKIGRGAILELWGSGPQLFELCQLRKKLNIDNSVIFRGYVDSVRERLKDMDVFVLPSSAEGNSNAILEAMAAGLPIVSTRVGGTPMLVGDEGAGLLIDVDDRAALADRLVKLINDSELRNQIGIAMRHRAERYFDIHCIADTYLNAYKCLITGDRDEIHGASNSIVREA